MNAGAKRKPKKPQRPRIFAVVRKLVDPSTGEEVAAFVPQTGIDRRLLRDRKVTTGSEWRLELSKPRNPKFFRLAHGLGVLVATQIEAFTGMDGHDVLKRLQVDSGVCCDYREIDLGELGKHAIKEAQSLSFDQMDETKFGLFWKGIVEHLCNTYWPTLTPEEVERQAELIGD